MLVLLYLFSETKLFPQFWAKYSYIFLIFTDNNKLELPNLEMEDLEISIFITTKVKAFNIEEFEIAKNGALRYRFKMLNSLRIYDKFEKRIIDDGFTIEAVSIHPKIASDKLIQTVEFKKKILFGDFDENEYVKKFGNISSMNYFFEENCFKIILSKKENYFILVNYFFEEKWTKSNGLKYQVKIHIKPINGTSCGIIRKKI